MRKLISKAAFLLACTVYITTLSAQGPKPFMGIGGGNGGGGGGGGSTEGNDYQPMGGTIGAATITCTTGKLHNAFSLLLTGNATIGAPSNCPVGPLVLYFTQEASPSDRTCTFNVVFIGLPPVPCDTGASHRSILEFDNDGTSFTFTGGSYPDASGHRIGWIDGQTTVLDSQCADVDATDDAYTCNWWGPIDSAYKINQQYGLCVAFTNVGPATVNFATVGAVAIKKLTAAGLVDLADGDMVAGTCYVLVYTPTSVMQLVSPIANVATSGVTFAAGDGPIVQLEIIHSNAGTWTVVNDKVYCYWIAPAATETLAYGVSRTANALNGSSDFFGVGLYTVNAGKTLATRVQHGFETAASGQNYRHAALGTPYQIVGGTEYLGCGSFHGTLNALNMFASVTDISLGTGLGDYRNLHPFIAIETSTSGTMPATLDLTMKVPVSQLPWFAFVPR